MPRGISNASFRQWISYGLTLTCGFVYGCKVGWLSSTITSILAEDSPPFLITQDDISWMASISFTSSIISVLLCFFIGNKFGRKVFLVGVAVYYVIAWALILFTSSATIIIICFCLYGIASGTQYIIGYVYVGEITSPRNRELIGTAYGIATAIGTEVEILMGLFDSYRLLALFPLIISIFGLLTAVFMVESPFYLVGHGEEEAAVRNLGYLHDWDEPKARAELQLVKEYVDEQKSDKEKLKENCKIMLQPGNLKLTVIMILLNGLSGMNNANVIPHTGSFMLKDFQSNVDGELFVNVYSLVNIVFDVCSFYTIRKFKRRGLSLFGYLGAAVLQFICAIFYWIESLDRNNYGWLAHVIAYLLVAFRVHATLTFSVAIEVLKIEIFPHKMKEFYISLLLCTSDWFIFVLIKSYFWLEPVVGNGGMMFLYGIFSLAAYTMTYVFVQDTKNKTLLEIRTDVNPECEDEKKDIDAVPKEINEPEPKKIKVPEPKEIKVPEPKRKQDTRKWHKGFKKG